jgi:hypothetical protein
MILKKNLRVFMKKFFNFETWTIGLAMFSMFFGAGNIIFPLAVGQIASDLAPYGDYCNDPFQRKL